MSAKKKIELFIEINNEREFEHAVNFHKSKLICAEIYSSYFGSCTALDRLFTKFKLDWGGGCVVLLKVLADEIEALKRFRGQSRPYYIFIVNKRITKVFIGVDGLGFEDVARKELSYYQQGDEASVRPTYGLDEATPEEVELIRASEREEQEESSSLAAARAARQAARKRHRAELMVGHLQHLSFVMYWPHAKHAHPELYERWNENNIIMVGREEVQLTEDKALDILYAGDAPLNEASIHTLISGPALAICFRLLDTDKDFISLVRKILYEEIQALDETKPMKDQRPQKTAFDYYKSYSPSREEIWQKRREHRARQKKEAIEKRARRLSEMQRLARQAIEDAIETKKAAKEQRKLELLKAGNLEDLNKLKQQPDDNIVEIEVPETLPEEEEVTSDDDDQDEYFPPAGLLVPGFYAPPNDIAKVNGLAILFPKLVLEHVTPSPEFLPPHVLVMLHLNKRHKAIKIMANHKYALIHLGIFKATTPQDAVHIAYSVKQYESMELSYHVDELRLALMVSISKDLPLLGLMDLEPQHLSRDAEHGERECAAMFPVGYADQYPQFEDFFDQ